MTSRPSPSRSTPWAYHTVGGLCSVDLIDKPRPRPNDVVVVEVKACGFEVGDRVDVDPLLVALTLGAPTILGVGRNVELLDRVAALVPSRIHVLCSESGASVADWARSLTGGERRRCRHTGRDSQR